MTATEFTLWLAEITANARRWHEYENEQGKIVTVYEMT